MLFIFILLLTQRKFVSERKEKEKKQQRKKRTTFIVRWRKRVCAAKSNRGQKTQYGLVFAFLLLIHSPYLIIGYYSFRVGCVVFTDGIIPHLLSSPHSQNAYVSITNFQLYNLTSFLTVFFFRAKTFSVPTNDCLIIIVAPTWNSSFLSSLYLCT